MGLVQGLALQKEHSLGPGEALGHNLGAQNSSLDLNRTWDGKSLGLVQGLALQKEHSLWPGEASFCQVVWHKTAAWNWTQLGHTK
jgi:type II secretory pathway component PulL